MLFFRLVATDPCVTPVGQLMIVFVGLMNLDDQLDWAESEKGNDTDLAKASRRLVQEQIFRAGGVSSYRMSASVL